MRIRRKRSLPVNSHGLFKKRGAPRAAARAEPEAAGREAAAVAPGMLAPLRALRPADQPPADLLVAGGEGGADLPLPDAGWGAGGASGAVALRRLPVPRGAD